jgi:Asp-tRNA(Asn)/Glu-tRNA(Gln) amidotransferase C subunit
MSSRPALTHTHSFLRAFGRQSYTSRSICAIYWRGYSTKSDTNQFKDIEKLLEKPTWSVESLLPSAKAQADGPKVSSAQLHHLLQISALPLPESAEEETKMLETLSAQLHFVGEIQQVDTSGVEPLRAIRDETEAAVRSQTITLDTLKEAFAQEEVIGKHYKRVKRTTDRVDAKEVEDWDVLGNAERKVGKYFVVENESP